MPLPVIADGFQAVLIWTSLTAPRPATNVLHFVDAVGTQTETNLYDDIAASVSAGLWHMVYNDATITQLQITKLDGTSAGQSFNPAAAAKWQGSATGHAVLQGSVVVSLKTAQRGPRGRNRIYLPWIGEDQQTDGTLDATNLATMQTAWNTFNSVMAGLGWDLSAVSALHEEAHSVNNIVLRPYLKTQRRRTRR